jgi:hypothetical protein
MVDDSAQCFPKGMLVVEIAYRILARVLKSHLTVIKLHQHIKGNNEQCYKDTSNAAE